MFEVLRTNTVTAPLKLTPSYGPIAHVRRAAHKNPVSPSPGPTLATEVAPLPQRKKTVVQ